MAAFRAGSAEQSRSIVEPQPGRRDDVIHSRAASGECFGGAPVSECESRHQRRSPFSGANPVDRCAEVQQGFGQRDLDAGVRRVAAGYQHAHGRVMPAVHVGQRVNFGAGMEQGFRNFNSVLGSPLAITLDAVGGDVMKKGGAMHRRVEMGDTRRTRPNQFRIFAQRRFQLSQCARDDCLHGRFELEDGRTVLSDGFDVLRERLPILKVVIAGDGEMRVGKVKRSASNFGVRQVFRQPWNFGIQETGMVFVKDPDCLGIARAAGCEQFLRLLVVLIQAGAKR